MRKLALAATLIACAAPTFGADTEKPDATDPMAGWTPPKVKNEKADKAEIIALFKKMEDSSKKGDLDAAMALIDFPVLMTTDNKKGEAMSASWNAEQYRKQMEPSFKPNPNMKVKHTPNIFLLSDSLATVDNVVTMTMGKKTMTARNAMLLIRTGGAWKIKAMTEGGWGDMMGEAPAAASSTDKAAGTGQADPTGRTPTGTGKTDDTGTAPTPGTPSQH